MLNMGGPQTSADVKDFLTRYETRKIVKAFNIDILVNRLIWASLYVRIYYKMAQVNQDQQKQEEGGEDFS